ncbi:hypothetical protein INT45_003849 [Circinella minor]|uniref:Uncharacterized protein n=1 Tax=Circinella minor TaxID=1195481 RepID=A0A8H7SCZ7_9FUNG|nr:hypothetical protein INT45_003849 [Circinella minor]
MAANHITDIPFTVEPEDLENNCALPQNTARCVSLPYRLISTPRAIREFPILLQELNKEDQRELQLYVDERDRTRWEYLDNDLKMDRAAKNIKLIFYNEGSNPNTSITDYEAQKDSIDGTSRIQQVDGDIQETEQGWSLEYLWQNIEKEEETEEEIFGCHTTEGESSATSIKRQTTSFYENVMERYIEFGFLELKSHTTVKSCLLPKSSIPLVAQNSQYHSLTTPIDDNIHFTRRGGIDVDGDNIDLNMDRHARQLAECILKGKTSWILISQIDAFYQNNTVIDDCARKRNHDYYESPRGFIIDKTMHDKSWREIVVRWGNFEFLTMRGYVGLCHGDKRRAFLDSALNKEVIDLINNDTKFKVLVPSAPVPNVQSYRYLRSYAKIAACKPWSYISKRFVRNNFEACHGLAIDHHPTRMNKKLWDRASIASIILRIAAKKIYSNDDRMKILELIEKAKDFTTY